MRMAFTIEGRKKSQSLWNRAGSFDKEYDQLKPFYESQSLWNRAGSFDDLNGELGQKEKGSQSLWNRAGSFDRSSMTNAHDSASVSIPLEQGRVFRLQGWFGALMDKA